MEFVCEHCGRSGEDLVRVLKLTIESEEYPFPGYKVEIDARSPLMSMSRPFCPPCLRRIAKAAIEAGD